MPELAKLHRVAPGAEGFDLDEVDARATPGFAAGGKGAARKALKAEEERLDSLQERLFASGARAVLCVFQAMDTGGKDGVVRKVFSGLDPQGVDVHAFKKPTPEEASHDFLWRVHKAVPPRGRIGVFIRSHYEDILVPTIFETLDAELVERRYERINEFERLLAGDGVLVLKFFLHISREEQKERLQARIDEPDKNWKFSMADIEQRKSWAHYREAYEACLSATSTTDSPWFAVPADDKQNAHLIISQIILDALTGLRMSYPRSDRARQRELRAIRKRLAK